MQTLSARLLWLVGCFIVGAALVVGWRAGELWSPAQPQPVRGTGKPAAPAAPNSLSSSARLLPGSAVAPFNARVAAGTQSGAATVPPEDAGPRRGRADSVRFAAVTGSDGAAVRVYPGRNRMAFAQLGLRPGDRLVAVNGATAEGQSWEQLVASLPEDGSLTIVVERRGQLLQLRAQAPDGAP